MTLFGSPPNSLELGLGLLSIGRTWGVGQSAPPDEAETSGLLERALDLGIRIFDTAPAYAASEARFGRFLATLDARRREDLVVMTKAGEHWDFERVTSFVDHGRDALRRSIDRSQELLGAIDLLQIHKATADVVGHPHVVAALDHARACGIRHFGASVSSVEAGLAAIETGLYRALQFPLNRSDRSMESLILALWEAGITPMINRPFAMGGLMAQSGDADAAARSAFRFIEERIGTGIVLTGTGKAAHLTANVAAFRART